MAALLICEPVPVCDATSPAVLPIVADVVECGGGPLNCGGGPVECGGGPFILGIVG